MQVSLGRHDTLVFHNYCNKVSFYPCLFAFIGDKCLCFHNVLRIYNISNVIEHSVISLYRFTIFPQHFFRERRWKRGFILANIQNGLTSLASLFRSATWTTREHGAAPISFVAALNLPMTLI